MCKAVSALHKSTQKQIDKFLLKLIRRANPRQFGEALKGSMQSLWRYRIGDYRLICDREVYKKNL